MHGMKKALVLVDLQNDFFPGGALPVPEGDSVVEPVNRLIAMADRDDMPVYATRDWHPEKHCSFREQGGPWPPHCVRGTAGAEFHPGIELPENASVVSKAESADKDAYSGFQGTDLARRLRDAGVSSLVVGGLATEVCVKSTVFDALDEGFDVTVVREAVSGIDKESGDSGKALEQMRERGARIVSIHDLAND